MTERQTRRIGLADQVRALLERSGGTYGSPRIFIELTRAGWRVSVNTVAKITAELGLAAREVRSRTGLTRPGKHPAAPDLVHRDFSAEEPGLPLFGDQQPTGR